MKSLLKIILWIALALGAQVVLAGTMRCGDSIIEGDQLVPATETQVLAACGEPTTREPGQWTYAQEGQFTRMLRFDSDGNLQSISVQTGGN